MIDAHVEPREQYQGDLDLKISVARVHGRIRREQQSAGKRRDRERGPGDRQGKRRGLGDAAIARGEPQQAQVDDRDRADHERQGQNVQTLDPREQHVSLANGNRQRQVLKPGENAGP